MQNFFAPLALAGLTFLSAPASASVDENWIQDFDKAVAMAKEQKKDLLVDFTGSDWCHWCIKLQEEVFDFDAFNIGVQSNFILVSLDFPRGDDAKAWVPNPKRNDELKNKYKVGGYPTVLLMTADGIVYGQTGYQEGGPEAYVKHVNELRAVGRKDLEKVQKTLDAFNVAEGDAKLTALGNLLDTFIALPADSPFAAMLVEPATSAIELDPKNEKGLKLRAVKGLSKAGIHNAALLSAAHELDAKNELGVLELAVQAQFQGVMDGATAKAAVASLDSFKDLTFQDKELGFMLYFSAASWAAGPMNLPELAKGYATRAKAIGNTEKRFMERLDEILGTEGN